MCARVNTHTQSKKANGIQTMLQNYKRLDFSSPGSTLLSMPQRWGFEGFAQAYEQGPYHVTGSVSASARLFQSLRELSPLRNGEVALLAVSFIPPPLWTQKVMHFFLCFQKCSSLPKCTRWHRIIGGYRLAVAGTPFLEVPGSVSKNNVSTLQTLQVPVGKMGILGSQMAWVILGLLAGDR